MGEVKNPDPSQYAAFNQLYFNFYDASGTLLSTDSTFTTVDTLAPGELSPFEEIFMPPAGYDHYTIASIASSAGSAPNHNFTTQITNQFTDIIGAQHIVGTVTNNNNTADTFVEIVFTFYDCAGTAIDGDFTFINAQPPTLAAGATVSFEEIRSSGAPPYASLRAVTQSLDAPSPLVLPPSTYVGPAPNPPTGVTALAGDSTATVRWTAPTVCNGGSPVTGYVVTSSPGGLTATAGVSATQVNIGGLANGTTYTFTVTASNSTGTSTPSSPSNAVTPNAITGAIFYFAEGYTGVGFQESLSLLMPNRSGTAQIDYYTQSGHLPSVLVAMNAGKVAGEDVNADIGPNQQVSVRVELPSSGVAERTIHFNLPGVWHGSTDVVGTTAPSTEWDFAEGSTLTIAGNLIFSEFLTLQNPNGTAVPVSLNYFTDTGLTPVKGLTLTANSRTTVEVFHGDTTNVSNCVPNGTGSNCGVGPGIGGVSVQVKSGTLPIIAERPFYVNNFSFGDGAISDGHDAFGANAASSTWNFAEGTTLGGFKEYLTLQNPGTAAATVNLNYFTDSGAHPVKTLTVNAHSRVTVEVFHGDATTNQNPCTASGTGANCGVGPNVGGVSVQVTSNQPIVAERPMYMVLDFGTGSVAGAHVVVGSTGLGTLFGFAAGSTLAGENDYLTIQNPGTTAAQVTITYYANAGAVTKGFSVNANSRVTVEVFKGNMTPNAACSPSAGSCGVGASVSPLGIVLQSSQPILVEKPTYNSTIGAYGATDTLGYSPSSF